jgi:hypothetical protein
LWSRPSPPLPGVSVAGNPRRRVWGFTHDPHCCGGTDLIISAPVLAIYSYSGYV